MPVKERRTKLFLLLFLTTDVSFEYTEITPALQKIFDITINEKTKGTISAMLKEGIIEKAPAELGAGYRLTRLGFLTLALEFPFFRFQVDQWDGLWRIISYEIPESKRKLRDRLRREVRGWGLGPWHRSFWITPHPIIRHLKELVYNKEEEEYIQAFEATHVFGKREVLVEKVWEKTALEQQYRDLFKKWHEILSTEIDKTDKMIKIVRLYLEVLRTDPGLPASLLGQKWIGFEAFEIYQEVRKILLG